METSRVFSEIAKGFADPAVRTIVSQGGTSSTKTISSLQFLIFLASKAKKDILISVVSETMPHLRRGCIRDFRTILERDGVYDPTRWHDGNKTYSFDHAKIEFFSADSPGKVHGPRRDYLYLNEAIYIDFEVFRQLVNRTREKVMIDYNAAWEFWAHTKVIPQPDSYFIKSTYLDNRWLTPANIAEIERNRDLDPEWWQVYGLGEIGRAEGLIIKNWDIVSDMTSTFKNEWIGLDFGFGDPTAAEHIRLSGGETWHDEIIYERGLTNPEIAKRIKDAGLAHLTIVADSAEPKSIAELRSMGLHVIPAEKGKDSIRMGLQVMNRYTKHFTARSLNSIEENRQYRWTRTPAGEYDTNRPMDRFNHAKDAARYVYLKFLSDAVPTFDFRVTKF